MMTFNVLEYCRQRRLPLVFSSTREVYGDVHRFEGYGEETADFAFTESPYSASKIAGEAFIYSYARCYGLQVPGLPLLERLRALRQRPAPDGRACCRSSSTGCRAASRSRSTAATTRCSTSPTSTTASTGSRAASRRSSTGRVANETINLAFGQGNTLVRAAELIAAELGVEPKMTIAPSLLGEVTRYVADIRKAHELLELGAADAARRGHPAGGRLVPGAPRRPSRGGQAGRERAILASRARQEDARSTAAEAVPARPRASSGRRRPARRRSPRRSPSGSRRARLRRLDAGLPRPADPDEAGRPAHGSSGSGRSTARARSASTRRSRTRRSTRSPRRERRRSSSAAPGSGSRRRSPTSSCRRRRSGRPGSAGSVSTTAAAPGRHTRSWSGATHVRPRVCTRTIASASSARSSSGRRAARSCRSSHACGPPSSGCRPSSSAWMCRARRWPRAFAHAPAGCSSRGWRTKCAPRATWRRRCSAWRPCATLPREEAIAELERATLRFAAYQRKWMRRIPGIVMIDAERPAGEVADAILESCSGPPPQSRLGASQGR